MRQKIVIKIITWFVVFVGVILFLAVNITWADSFKKEIRIVNSNWISLKYTIKWWNGSGWTVRDTATLTSPDSATESFGTDTLYTISYDWQSPSGTTGTSETVGELVDDYKADVSLLALQTEVANLDGWNPATDSVNVDGTAFASLQWAINLLAFIGWGEVGGEPVWADESRNNNADTLWVGWLLSGGPPNIDTLAYQVNFHVGGTAGDPPDTVKSYLWP